MDPPSLRSCEWVLSSREALDSVRCIAFAGGAVRGLEYIGVLDALKSARGIDWGVGVPHKLRGVSGTSIGALFALMLAVGFSVAEIRAWGALVQPTSVVAISWHNVVNGCMALDDGARLRALVSSIIATKARGARDMTFRTFVSTFGVDLVVVATDVRAFGVRYLRAATDPDVSVVSAVVASMSLPLIFPPVHVGNAVLVDGGVMDNIPPVTLWRAEEVLGLALSVNVLPPDETTQSHVRALITTTSLAAGMCAWRVMPRAYKERCLVLRTDNRVGIPSLSMHLDPEAIEQLIQCGRQEMLDALAGRPDPRRDEALRGDVTHCLDADLLQGRQLPLFLASVPDAASADAGNAADATTLALLAVLHALIERRASS